MISVDVDCPLCGNHFSDEVEHENAGDGDTQKTECPSCLTAIKYDLSYIPCAFGEEVISDES